MSLLEGLHVLHQIKDQNLRIDEEESLHPQLEFYSCHKLNLYDSVLSYLLI